MREKFLVLAEYVVKCCFFAFCLIFAFFNIFFSTDVVNSKTIYLSDLNVIPLVIAIIICVTVVYLNKNNFFGISEKALLLSFIILAFVIGCYWILSNSADLYNLDDAYNVFNAAKKVCEGNYSPLSFGSYISTYPNNLGLLTYEVIHIKIFGAIGALYSIRFVNLCFVLLGYYYLYRITKVLFNNENTSKTIILLMVGSIQFVFYSSFVYGNCLSYSLAIISIYYLISYLKDAKVSHLVLSAFLVLCSIFIKSNSLIVLIAEIIYLFLEIVENKRYYLAIVIVAMILGSILCTSGLEKFWGNRAEINYDTVKLPTVCWIAYGANYDHDNPGRYFGALEKSHVENGYVVEFTKNEAKEFINNTFSRFRSDYEVGFDYYCRKFLAAWCNPTFEAFEQHKNASLTKFNGSLVNGSANFAAYCFWNGILSTCGVGLVLLVFKYNKKIKLLHMICATVVLGGFFFHAFWEIKAVYLYQYYLFLLPYCAYGLSIH